jgi:uncharacterized protein (DUF362 family)/NAD-dependent dihydropyrimidine dehydrogenase PreA subunit
MNRFKVAIKKCSSYENTEKIYQIIEFFFSSFPEVEKLVKPGITVLLKPNMLSCKTPDKAATTHPAIVEAIARYFSNRKANVLIGDSPPAIFGRAEKYWETTGFKTAAENSVAKLICFETLPKHKLSFFSNNTQVELSIVKTYYDADMVINIAKLKTHNLTRITAAIKNLFGLVPGFQKAIWHKIFPKSYEFGNFITDLSQKLPVHLNILDAIEGMDGQGPAGGRRIFPGFLLASDNPVAIDRTICAAAQIDENSIATLNRAKEIKWGPESINELDFTGAPLKSIKFQNFRVPGISPQDYIPDFVLNSLKKLLWIGPFLKPGKCIGCGRCAEVCPVDAIELSKNEAQFNRKTCISCFCCMEVCPVDAIKADKSPLLSLAFKLKNLGKKSRKGL